MHTIKLILIVLIALLVIFSGNGFISINFVYLLGVLIGWWSMGEGVKAMIHKKYITSVAAHKISVKGNKAAICGFILILDGMLFNFISAILLLNISFNRVDVNTFFLPLVFGIICIHVIHVYIIARYGK